MSYTVLFSRKVKLEGSRRGRKRGDLLVEHGDRSRHAYDDQRLACEYREDDGAENR